LFRHLSLVKLKTKLFQKSHRGYFKKPKAKSHCGYFQKAKSQKPLWLFHTISYFFRYFLTIRFHYP
jgi:hypothetical protein